MQEDECEKLCPDNCVDTAYAITLATGSDPRQLINFEHDYQNDILAEHLPAIDWITYLGTVGGLAGMWLGFSLASIPGYFFFLVKKGIRFVHGKLTRNKWRRVAKSVTSMNRGFHGNQRRNSMSMRCESILTRSEYAFRRQSFGCNSIVIDNKVRLNKQEKNLRFLGIVLITTVFCVFVISGLLLFCFLKVLSIK